MDKIFIGFQLSSNGLNVQCSWAQIQLQCLLENEGNDKNKSGMVMECWASEVFWKNDLTTEKMVLKTGKK